MGPDDIVEYIFGNEFHISFDEQESSNPSTTVYKKSLYLRILSHEIEKVLRNACDPTQEEADKDSCESGRIGPDSVCFDVSKHAGIIVIGSDRLSINSQANFSTILANVCVSKGKWQYEVQLGSKGVMQIGWATSKCKFSQEIGVGDTKDSYAYDGNRVRKWNVSTYRYGQPWLCGDVIGCLINLDEGKMEFSRNGRSMGEAFSNVHVGPGMAYFPAVSMAQAENIMANFGSLPMRYPVEGYKPLQERPQVDIAKARLLCSWMSKLLTLVEHNPEKLHYSVHVMPINGTMSNKGFFLGITRIIFDYLAPLLLNPYIIVCCIFPLIEELCELDTYKLLAADDIKVNEKHKINIFLDMLWAFTEEFEMRNILEQILVQLICVYRTVSLTTEFIDQKHCLRFLTHLLNHSYTRYYVLENLLFDKIRFINFLHVKPIDDEGLVEAIPKAWWHSEKPDIAMEENKTAYFDACDNLKLQIHGVEILQINLLKILLNNADETSSHPSSRKVFLKKLRAFVHDNFVTSQTLPFLETPLPVALCGFFRLLVTFRILWEEEVKSPVIIPPRCFYDETINYYDIERLGGLLSHLQKTLKTELIEALGEDHKVIRSINQQPSVSLADTSNQNALAVLISGQLPSQSVQVVENNGVAFSIPVVVPLRMLLPSIHNNVIGSVDLEEEEPSLAESPTISIGYTDDSPLSLIELLDSIILLYHSTAHKQISQMSSLRETIAEFDKGLISHGSRLTAHDTDTPSDEDVAQVILGMKVLADRLSDQCRYMSWALATVFSEEKQNLLVWLLQAVIQTLKLAAQENQLFSFVPDFYLEVLMELTTALRNHMHPTCPMSKIEGYRNMLTEIAEFLCECFCDSRIVQAQSKDTLMQALAGFICNPTTLTALESTPYSSRLRFAQCLLRPYENRAWAQNNWILVRIWQGCGFAFRYEKSPHLRGTMGPKLFQNDTSLVNQKIKPCPSLPFQFHIREVLVGNVSLATAFLNSLLNQLNWAFSEFIGMLQEIQNVSCRPERVFIESRQLRVCATCFDLTISLMRVLEMIATVAGEVFKDFTRSSADLLSARLFQLICQVLNRVSFQSGCFQHVISLNIPDLETVDHFPILAAVVGLMLALLGEELHEFNTGRCALPAVPHISKVFLSDPSFQINSLHFLIRGTSDVQSKKDKRFSFLKYPEEVNADEIDRVRLMVFMLETYCNALSDTKIIPDDDSLCTICYANPISATFKPCNHDSCRACITHYLMNCNTCFFCKVRIETVICSDGTTIHITTRNSTEQLAN